jgi:hypothetical protein
VSELAVGSEPELLWLMAAFSVIALIMFFRWRRQRLV